MRKALIAAVVAAALFAVGAFAASFAVDSVDVASGNDPVSACAAKVVVDFGTPTFNNATHDWTVSSATVSFQNDAGAAVTTCSKGKLTLNVSTTSGSVVSGTATVGDASSSATVGFTATAVKTIDNAAVLVDGIFLTTGS
jgi:hypothetical protein